MNEIAESRQIENEDIRTPFKEFIIKFKKQKTALLSVFFLMILFALGLIGPYLTKYRIDTPNYQHILEPPSSQYWFGTDEFGRDIFTRVISGSRISLSIGFISVTVGMIIGTTLGLISGILGGLIDNLIMRVCDTLFAFPSVILAIGIIAIFGSGTWNVVIAVAFQCTPQFSRIVRASALNLKESVFVQAAKCIGASKIRIMFKHVLPGAVPNIIVYYTMSIGSSILTASSLSFLGMGASPPTPEWGLMLSNGRAYIGLAWHMAFFPGMMIALTVFAFNLLGDGLRDALDPKLTE